MVAVRNPLVDLVRPRVQAVALPAVDALGPHIYVIKKLDSAGVYQCVYAVLTGPPGVNVGDALRTFMASHDVPVLVDIDRFLGYLQLRHRLVRVFDHTTVDVAVDDDNTCLWAE